MLSLVRLAIVPPDTERQAYTVLREIYLERFADFLSVAFNSESYDKGSEWGEALLIALERQEEIESWLRPPMPPLSAEKALQIIEGTKSELWRDAVLGKIGKHRKRGQPPKKQHLAVRALDVKCAAPQITLLRLGHLPLEINRMTSENLRARVT